MAQFNDSDKFLTLALNNISPINGMYVLYTRDATTAIPSLVTSGGTTIAISTSGGITTSGGSLDALKEHVVSQGNSMGLARVNNTTPRTLFTTLVSSGGSYSVVSNWTSAGGSITVTSGATTTFYATTADAAQVCGLPLVAGCYARAAMLAHIDSCHVEKDTALDYNVLAAPIIFPANGAITLIEKVTAN